MAESDTFIKRLVTVQNMSEDHGVKEICEILIDLLEKLDKKDMGFKK